MSADLIKPYDILIIPFGWRYLQEINNKTITYHIDIDDYFTFIHNTILNKISDEFMPNSCHKFCNS